MSGCCHLVPTILTYPTRIPLPSSLALCFVLCGPRSRNGRDESGLRRVPRGVSLCTRAGLVHSLAPELVAYLRAPCRRPATVLAKSQGAARHAASSRFAACAGPRRWNDDVAGSHRVEVGRTRLPECWGNAKLDLWSRYPTALLPIRCHRRTLRLAGAFGADESMGGLDSAMLHSRVVHVLDDWLRRAHNPSEDCCAEGARLHFVVFR